MRTPILSLAVSLWCVVPCAASAQSLSVGDDAPPITVSRWIKGQPVDHLEPGKTYVVEFWATWCGPCRTSIPHLTELQKKFKDRGVTFLGISVWEQDQDKVKPFVEQMGDKMEYQVALDDVPEGERGNQGKMALGWMQAAEEDGIPTAFVVKDKKIFWIGHPMSLDTPLEKVVSGDLELAVAAKEHREAKALEGKIRAARLKIGQAVRSGKPDEALKAIDEAINDNPALEESFASMKFTLLRDGGRDDEAVAYGNKMVETVFKGNAPALNFLAWSIVDPAGRREEGEKALRFALKAAERANELTHGENAAILDTLARVHFVRGEPARALELQEKAVELATGEDQGLKDRLEQYRKAAEEKDKDR